MHCVGLCPSFDRTYEGLKPDIPYFPEQYIPAAFDRTYEGLKLFLTTSATSPSRAFDRTYEGLKHPDYAI